MIEREALCALIPHAGDMCLLDSVEAWDATDILCHSNSHRRDAHPLRRDGRVAVVHGLEYGAQAMAVHGGLLARDNGRIAPPGYLAALREVRFYVDFLDDIDAPLEVRAHCLVGGAGGSFMYEFSVHGGGREVLEARATVIAQTGGAA